MDEVSRKRGEVKPGFGDDATSGGERVDAVTAALGIRMPPGMTKKESL